MFHVDQHRRIDAASWASAYEAKAARIASLVITAGVNTATRPGSPANRVAMAVKS